MSAKGTFTIDIPEPCGEDWNAMKPNGCGRFCAACRHTVIDFTVMTDAQIIDIFRKSETIPCGRFLPEQLNRALQEPGKIKPFPFYRKIAAAILALQAFTVTSFAQAKKKPAAAVHEIKPKRPGPQRTIKGILFERAGKPQPGMQLTLTAEGYEPLNATTDAGGCFLFILPGTYTPAIMHLSLVTGLGDEYTGYVHEDIPLNRESLSTELMVYRFFRTVLPEAQVTTARPYNYGGSSLGGIPAIHYSDIKLTTWQKITKTFRKKRYKR